MSNLGTTITYKITWFVIGDNTVCEKCRALEDKEWNVDTLSGILEAPGVGECYDLDLDLPLTHENCRCWLQVDPQIELENSEYFNSVQTNLSEWGYMPSNIEDAKEQVRELDTQVGLTYVQFRMFERILQRSLSLLKQAGLPPEAEQAIIVLTRLVWTVRILTTSLHALQLASGNPLAIANAVLGLGTAGMMAVTSLEMT